MGASLLGNHHAASVIKFVSDQPVRILETLVQGKQL